jgi:dTDP-4-dehydrorhamnose 3,5-epimerase|tara:strand:+ start:374 stop:922 length:549 start_codon:yes stop_codon:yes gene_type:complete
MQVDYHFNNSVLLFKPEKHFDERGFFAEVYNLKVLEELGVKTKFVQDNYSFSRLKNVFRGLHIQNAPHAQAKLVRVLSGSIMDIVVDLRKESSTYLSHKMFELSKRNFKQIYIPQGFAHGFLTLSPNTEVLYKTSDYYFPSLETSLSWEDRALNIKLPIKKSDLIISERDQHAISMDQLKEE